MTPTDIHPAVSSVILEDPNLHAYLHLHPLVSCSLFKHPSWEFPCIIQISLSPSVLKDQNAERREIDKKWTPNWLPIFPLRAFSNLVHGAQALNKDQQPRVCNRLTGAQGEVSVTWGVVIRRESHYRDANGYLLYNVSLRLFPTSHCTCEASCQESKQKAAAKKLKIKADIQESHGTRNTKVEVYSLPRRGSLINIQGSPLRPLEE